MTPFTPEPIAFPTVVGYCSGMPTDELHTLYGYDHLAQNMRPSTPGIKTGAHSTPGGRTHLCAATGRTACGRKTTGPNWAVTLVPANVDEASWRVRIALCASCWQHAVTR